MTDGELGAGQTGHTAQRVEAPPRPSGPSVAVVVVTQNSAASIDACLRSVADWANEIVVVDRGSADGTREIVRRYTSRVLDAPYSAPLDLLGFACSQTSADWIFALEPDDIVPGKLARVLLRYAAGYDADIIRVPDRPLTFTPEALPLVAATEERARFFRRSALAWQPGSAELLDRTQSLEFTLPGDNADLALYHQSADPESVLVAVGDDAIPQGIGRSFGVLPSVAAVLFLSSLGFALVVHKEAYATILLFAALALVVLYRPQWSLFLLVIGLPIHNLMMTAIYQSSDSISLTKIAQPWKELVLATAILRVGILPLVNVVRTRRVRLVPLDVIVLLFVLLCAVSVALPNSTISLTGRLYGFRDLVLPFGAYFVARNALLSRKELKALLVLSAGVVGVFALAAIGERVLWGNSLLFALDYGRYLKDLFGQTFPLPHNTPFTFYTAGYFPRAGSLALDPLDLAVLLLTLLPILLGALGVLRRPGSRLGAIVFGIAAFLGGVALLLAFGRESLALFPVALALLLFRKETRRSWPGVALSLAGIVAGYVLLAIVATYVARGTTSDARLALANQGLVSLIQEHPGQLPSPADLLSSVSDPLPGESLPGGPIISVSADPNNPSTQGHLQSLKHLAKLMIERPLGYGIGTAGQNGMRFNTGIGGESSYLTVGVELGWLGFLLYLVTFVLVGWSCFQASRARLPKLDRAVLWGAAIAWTVVALDGIFAEVTLNLFVMYTLLWLAGFSATKIRSSRVRLLADPNGGAPIWTAPRPLRVAVDAQCLQTARTGVRTYVDEMFRLLRVSGVPHTVVPLPGPKRLPNEKRSYRVLNQAMYFFWLHCWLPVRLSLGNYDVLFSPEYLTPFWIPTARVVTVHDAAFLKRPQDYNRLWLTMFRRVTLPAIRRADAVIVPSQHAAAEVTEYARIPAERIHVVPQGGPSPEAMRVPEERAQAILERFDVRPGAYVLHVGVLEHRKNLVTLVRACEYLREFGAPPDFKLVLVGQAGPRPDLDDSQAIRQAIAEQRLESRVVLTGHVTLEERNAFYTHAAVVAIPSLLEGFGLPLLEAFAAGAPVVAARASSLPEVAGDAALLFDPTSPRELAEAIIKLLSDPALRERLGAAGRERAALFTWERTAHETLAVFEAADVRAYAPLVPGIRLRFGFPANGSGKGRRRGAAVAARLRH